MKLPSLDGNEKDKNKSPGLLNRWQDLPNEWLLLK